MATTLTPFSPGTTRIPHLWHLLSLDAPTVAVLWTLFPARLTRIPISPTLPISMALAVWALYATDRLLDSNLGRPDLQPRHLFHHHHRRLFLPAIAAATALLAILVPHLPDLRLYLAEAAVLAAYFLLVHATPSAIPKELCVGLFFAAATAIPTLAHAHAFLPQTSLFAAVCTINGLYIHAWEHPNSPNQPIRFLLAHLPTITTATILLALTLILRPHPAYASACALSLVILLTLHRTRHRFSAITLRTAADAALLTPILFLPFV